MRLDRVYDSLPQCWGPRERAGCRREFWALMVTVEEDRVGRTRCHERTFVWAQWVVWAVDSVRRRRTAIAAGAVGLTSGKWAQTSAFVLRLDDVEVQDLHTAQSALDVYLVGGLLCMATLAAEGLSYLPHILVAAIVEEGVASEALKVVQPVM